jgi:hypothetical protein
MKKYLLVMLVGAGIGLAPPGAKASVTASLSQFTGDPTSIGVTITSLSSGGVQFQLLPKAGSITGFWINLPSITEGLLTGATVEGANIVSSTVKLNSVTDLGGGVNLQGGGNPGAMDVGVRFEKKTGMQSFVLLGANVTEATFANATFGARIQAIQTGRGGEGSSKLVGNGTSTPPGGPTVPDASSTAMLLGMSLCGIEWLRRKIKS